jgi:hypothetical protein
MGFNSAFKGLIHVCEGLWKLLQVDEATYGEGSGSLCVLFKLFITSELIEKSSLSNLWSVQLSININEGI